MAAYVVAVDSAYFAVSDERGPLHHARRAAGHATRYHAWRPGQDDRSGHVVVDAGHGRSRSTGHDGARLRSCLLALRRAGSARRAERRGRGAASPSACRPRRLSAVPARRSALLGEIAARACASSRRRLGHALGRGRSDVFGTAYPYGGTWQSDRGLRRVRSCRRGAADPSIKGGRYRTPFGIYAASDHAYIGFLRAPLIRYGEYYALSNGYLEHGVRRRRRRAAAVGRGRASGAPGDVGEAIRRPGVDTRGSRAGRDSAR